MGLFNKKKREELPADIRRAADALATAQEIFEQQDVPTNYSTVLNWMFGLSDKEFAKMGKVVEIYRKANSDTAKALGIKTEPTSFLPQPDNTETVPQDVNHLSPNSAPVKDSEDELDDFLNDDLDSAFLADDDAESSASKVQRAAAEVATKPPVKVDVKDENDKPADKPKG